jgi:mycofactocin precursor
MDQNPGTEAAVSDDAELTASDLIEEVSIDGMCGVY